MFKKISLIIILITVITITMILLFNCQTVPQEDEKDDSSSSVSSTSSVSSSSSSSEASSSSSTFTAPETGLVTAVPAVTVSEMSLTAGTYYPASGATGVNVDTLLRIGFDSAPTINSTGTINIYTSTGTLVDTINLADVAVTNATAFQALTTATANTKVNVIGNTPGSGTDYPNQVRVVNYYPVVVDGTTLKIIPHNNKLAYGTSYYVLIDNGAITGNISSVAFTGITSATAWTFTTKAAASVSGTTISVDSDGTGDFSTIQGALDYIPAANTTAYTINIANGVYEEMLFIRNKLNITLNGENQSNTIIQYDNYDSYNNGTGGGTAADAVSGLLPATTFARGGRSIFLIASTGGEMSFTNLTINSSHAQGSAANNQAETFYYNNTSGKLTAKNCCFTGYQDTMQVKGFSWFYNCFISGDVDFMWGANNTALYERCEIQSRFNTNGGYLVQARSVANYGGFIFLNCDLTKEAAVVDNSVYLARSYTTSGANAAYNDNVAFINCKMDSHIRTIGFLLPATVLATNPGASTPAAGWREYCSFNHSGLLDLSGRGATNGTTAVAGNPYSTAPTTTLGCIQLSAGNVSTFYASRAAIFAESTTDGIYTLSGVTGGWNPVP